MDARCAAASQLFLDPSYMALLAITLEPEKKIWALLRKRSIARAFASSGRQPFLFPKNRDANTLVTELCFFFYPYLRVHYKLEMLTGLARPPPAAKAIQAACETSAHNPIQRSANGEREGSPGSQGPGLVGKRKHRLRLKEQQAVTRTSIGGPRRGVLTVEMSTPSRGSPTRLVYTTDPYTFYSVNDAANAVSSVGLSEGLADILTAARGGYLPPSWPEVGLSQLDLAILAMHRAASAMLSAHMPVDAPGSSRTNADARAESSKS